MKFGKIDVFSRGGRFTITRRLNVGLGASNVSPRSAASMVDAWCDDSLTRGAMLALYEELSGARFRAPTRSEMEQWIKPRLCKAFENGDLVVVEASGGQGTSSSAEVGVVAKSTKKDEPPPEDAPPPRKPAPLPKTLHNFAIRLVDEIGTAISDVELLFAHAGTKEDGTTDGNGVARIEESPAVTAVAKIVDVAKLKKSLKPKWDTVRGDRKWLDESQGVTVVPLAGDKLPAFDLVAEKLRIVSIQPGIARARLIGGFFDSNKCFVLPAGLGGIRGLVGMYEEFPRSKMLVVGHTDTAGKPSFNDPLSLERAEAMKDYLTDNVDGWLKWYESGVSDAKRWGATEDGAMIGALPDASSRDSSESPVRWFQRTRSLKVDGKAGPETRKALVKEYMDLDGTSLPNGIEVVAHGCGENFPRKKTADESEDPENRRVEVFFFDGVLGVQPPPKGKNSAAGSAEYPEWVRRTKRTDDFGGKDGFDIRLVSADGHAIPEARFVVVFADGSSQEGTLDADGHARIEGAPPGPFKVEYPDLDDVRAKALAARIHGAFAANDTELILGVLSQPAGELDRVSKVYDRYFNDRSGAGMSEDAYAALGDTGDGASADHLLAAAGQPPRSGAVVVAYVEPNPGRTGTSDSGGVVV
ncbi:MAG: peptidoglycan-binding protein [Polyangiaceae bacterium]